MLVTDVGRFCHQHSLSFNISVGHQHSKIVTNLEILLLTSHNCHQDKVTNIDLSTTSIQPNLDRVQSQQPSCDIWYMSNLQNANPLVIHTIIFCTLYRIWNISRYIPFCSLVDISVFEDFLLFILEMPKESVQSINLDQTSEQSFFQMQLSNKQINKQ